MRKFKSTFRPSMTLTDALYDLIHRGILTPDQLQEIIDYSTSALKRACLNSESGAGFNLQKLLPATIAQRDCTVLDYLEYRINRIAIPLPVGGRSKRDRIKSVAEFQKLCALAVSTMITFVEYGGSIADAQNALYQTLRSTVELMEDVKKGRQIELDFESGM